jgi:hypothetical protein
MSDKLFYWVFQSNPDWILDLQPDLVAAAGLAGDAAGVAGFAPSACPAAGYRFSAPVLKEREYRLDGLFLPPPQLPELPAVILEAQMAADPGFLRRLYAESARWLQQAKWPPAVSTSCAWKLSATAVLPLWRSLSHQAKTRRPT